MKVVDAHAHIFPQKIAERAVSSIGSFYGIPMDDDGTADVLLREMQDRKCLAESCLFCCDETGTGDVH